VIIKRVLMCKASATTDYAGQSRLLRILANEGIEPRETFYEADGVKIVFYCYEDRLPNITSAVQEATAGDGKVIGDGFEYVTIS